jgi:hypothetical protein
MQRLSVSIPSVALVVATILVAGLLIAGYGVPVGVGLLVGFGAGWSVGLLAGLRMSLRRSEPAVSSHAWLSSERGPGDPLEISEPLRRLQRVRDADAGELVRVLAGGATAAEGGVQLELVALEIRSAGAVAHLVALVHPRHDNLWPFVDAVVSDDAATTYVAAGMASGGSPGRMRFELSIKPAPPAAATVLRLRVESFMDPVGTAETTTRGPWEFDVDLAG